MPQSNSVVFDLSISGMTCTHCSSRVEHALREVDGVGDIKVNVGTGQVRLHAPSNSLPTLIEAISAAGYAVSSDRAELDIVGMHCASCVRHVEHALRDVPSVRNAVVTLETGRAHIDIVGSTDPAPLIAAIEEAGYSATPVEAVASREAGHK